jgi:rhodanese-related sulfurtransferase
MNLDQQQWWEDAQQDENAVILDVRTPEEWNDGIIPGAITIDYYKGQGFIEEVKQLDKSKNYYIYCRSGARSGNACGIFNQLGFENAYNLSGGIMQWSGPVVALEK